MKKIIGIFVCMLMIVAAVLPVAGTMNNRQLDVGVDSITSPDDCIPIGCQSIAAIIKNYGGETADDIIVYAEIWELISDPNGTLVYQDTDTVTNLNPGITQLVTFDDYCFTVEGQYMLVICTALSGDTNPANDCIDMFITVDGTPPVTTHLINPPAPDGLNGWYVTCPTITLTADDIRCCGVDKTYYRLDSTSPSDPFIEYTGTPVGPICDCKHTLEYYSVDTCGNEETVNSVDFKVDTTPPTINYFRFMIPIWLIPPIVVHVCIAHVQDACSGILKVEFYAVVPPNPPTPFRTRFPSSPTPSSWDTFALKFAPLGASFNFYAIVYDVAGHSAVGT